MSEPDPPPLIPMRLEEALWESEERYRMIAETAADAIVTIDGESRILYVNSSAERIFGYATSEMLGQPLTMLIPRPLRHAHSAGLKRYLETGERHLRQETIELTGLHKSGREIPIEMSFGKSIQNGAPIFIGIVRDITERKRAETARKESEANYRSLFEDITEGLFEATPEGAYLNVNPALARMYGFATPHELMDAAPTIRHHSLVDQERRLEIDRQLERNGIVQDFEYQVHDRYGKPIWLKETARAFRDDGGKILYLKGRVEEVSAQKRAEAERQGMFEIIRAVHATSNLDELLRLTHQALKKVVSAENCRVGLYDKTKDLLEYAYYVDQHEKAPATQNLGKSFAASVLRTGQPLLLTKQVLDKCSIEGNLERPLLPAQCWIGVPLRARAETIGVIVLQHYENEWAYSDRDLEFLASVGNQIALAIERTRAEDTLRSSEASFRLLFAHNPMPTWVLDLETLKFLQVNEAAVSHYGYSREEFLNMLITDICPPEDVPVIEELLQKDCLPVNSPGNWRHRTKGGQIIHVEMNSHRLEFGDKKAALVVAQDITDWQRAQEALQQSEANYRSLVLEAPYGICRASREGRLLDVNPALVEMLGYGGETELRAVNLELGVFWDPAERRRLFELHPDRLDGAETVWKRKDGTPITIRLSRRPLAGGTGSYELIAENVTEQRALENKFRQAQKMEAVGRLAGGVAHDFNNLLMIIRGHLDLLLEQFHASDSTYHKLEQVRKAADRATALTRQLLAFSRMQILNPRIINLNTIVGEICKLLRPLLGENVELALALDQNLGRVKADPGQMEQVIMNLAVNARDAMPEGGRLAVETSNVELDEAYARAHPPLTAGHYVRLLVSDTGTGMDPETQTHIFEPFFTTKERGKGTGLGLATVYGIVKQSGGFIWVDSEPGHGTKFQIYLPLAMEPAEKDTPLDLPSKPPVGTETILIAEDENGVREVAREFLIMSGYNVLEAKNGAEAMEIAQRYPGPIHVLVTDRMMPGMSGPELAAKLMTLQPEIKIIYMSGYSEFSALPAGIDPETVSLQKPFTRDALVRAVRNVLDGTTKSSFKEGVRLTIES